MFTASSNQTHRYITIILDRRSGVIYININGRLFASAVDLSVNLAPIIGIVYLSRWETHQINFHSRRISRNIYWADNSFKCIMMSFTCPFYPLFLFILFYYKLRNVLLLGFSFSLVFLLSGSLHQNISCVLTIKIFTVFQWCIQRWVEIAFIFYCFLSNACYNMKRC